MRFTIREGTDPTAHADGVMLRALGLPSGGVVKIGSTHVQIAAGEMKNPTDIVVSAESIDNAGVGVNESVEVKRAILAPAEIVRLDDEILDDRHLKRALQGSRSAAATPSLSTLATTKATDPSPCGS